jgi:hypothetical protein
VLLVVPGLPDYNAGQVVDENKVYGNGRLGLTVHLTFDAASDESISLERARRLLDDEGYDEKPWEDIPCYALRCGEDVEKAATSLERYLRLVIKDVAAREIVYEVYEEAE